MEYRLLIDIEVIELLDTLQKKERNRLIDQFEKIRSFRAITLIILNQMPLGGALKSAFFRAGPSRVWIDPSVVM